MKKLIEGYCVNKILCVNHGSEQTTDRDSFMYKELVMGF